MFGQALARASGLVRGKWSDSLAPHGGHLVTPKLCAKNDICIICITLKVAIQIFQILYQPKSRDTNFSNFVSPKKFSKFLRKFVSVSFGKNFFDTDLIIFIFFNFLESDPIKKNITVLINGHDMIQMIQIQDMSTIAPTPARNKKEINPGHPERLKICFLLMK